MPIPTLLLHGALGSGASFSLIKERLGKNKDWLSLDLPGHGTLAGESQPFRMDYFADAVRSFILAQKIEQVNIFGYSMGGYVALSLAYSHPQLIGKIVTLGTKFDWTPESASKEVKMLQPEKMEEKVPQFAKYLAELHGETHWKSVVTRTASMMLGLAQGEGLADEQLRAIRNNVLICRGEQDHMVSEQESEHTAKLLPHGQFLSLPNCPHPLDKVSIEALYSLILHLQYPDNRTHQA